MVNGSARRSQGIFAAIVVGVLAVAGWFGAAQYTQDSLRLNGTAPARLSSGSDDIEAAWRAVHDDPQDPDRWVRLGEVQTKRDQLEGAEHSFRTAIRMGGGDGLAYARLGFILYARHEDREALTLLSEAKRRGAQVPMLEFTLQSLKERFAPPELSSEANAAPPPPTEVAPAPVASTALPSSGLDAGVGSFSNEAFAELPEEERAEASPEPLPETEPESEPDGVCEVAIRRPHAHRTFSIDVAINGIDAALELDTGASITLVTRAFVRETGLRWAAQPPIWAITANGRVQMETGRVAEIAVGDRVIENLRVAICDNCVQGFSDGLLGLDVQAAMGMKIDLVRARITFADCE